MSGEILTTIIAVLTIFGFMYAQTARITRGQERLSADIAAVNERLSAEMKEVRADIAVVNERLSHTDGLVEGLSRALLTSRRVA